VFFIWSIVQTRLTHGWNVLYFPWLNVTSSKCVFCRNIIYTLPHVRWVPRLLREITLIFKRNEAILYTLKVSNCLRIEVNGSLYITSTLLNSTRHLSWRTKPWKIYTQSRKIFQNVVWHTCGWNGTHNPTFTIRSTRWVVQTYRMKLLQFSK